MSDILTTVAYFTRIVDGGDYYIIEYFDYRFIVRKKNVERDVLSMLRRVPCPYAYAILRVLSLRVRFDMNAIMKNIRC
jgi:hypothetical protein